MAPATPRRPETYRRSLWVLDPNPPDASGPGRGRPWLLYVIPTALLAAGVLLLVLGVLLWSGCAPSLATCPPPVHNSTTCAGLGPPGACLHSWVLPAAALLLAGLVTFPIANWIHRRHRPGPRPPGSE